MSDKQGLKNLMGKSGRGTTKSPKPTENKETNEKAYRSFYMRTTTSELLNKIHIMGKLDNSKYSLADALDDAILLLAQERKIDS